jgi:hypothetical protein
VPCSDGLPASYGDGYDNGKRAARVEIAALKSRNDALSQMLCYLLTNYSFGKLPMAINVWWRSHQEFDRQREAEAKEVERVRALRRGTL